MSHLLTQSYQACSFKSAGQCKYIQSGGASNKDGHPSTVSPMRLNVCKWRLWFYDELALLLSVGFLEMYVMQLVNQYLALNINIFTDC